MTRTPVIELGIESEFIVSARTEISGVVVNYRHPRAGIAGHRIIPSPQLDSIFLPAGRWRIVLELVPRRVLWWRSLVAAFDHFVARIVGSRKDR